MLMTRGVRETAVYASDLEASAQFYEDNLGLPVLLRLPRLVALDAGAGGVLLVFKKGGTLEDIVDERGVIPAHDAQGRLHFALTIATKDLLAWRAHLAARGIEIVGEYRWPRGGVSLYFHDPDGHLVELATPGLWANEAGLPGAPAQL
jgi:catechol 2,3-dioxygenase-like lactoylglutathione lyase family enzyme